jgi:hypothetical protein
MNIRFGFPIAKRKLQPDDFTKITVSRFVYLDLRRVLTMCQPNSYDIIRSSLRMERYAKGKCK